MAIGTSSTVSSIADRPSPGPSRPGAAWRDLVAILVLAAAVRLAAAALIHQPGYTDAFYYYNIAANLAAGRGFVEDFVWNYLRPVESLPQPSNGYWPPLVSLSIAGFLIAFGESFRAAQIPSVCFGSVAALIGYLVGRDLGGNRRAAWWTGLLTLFSGVAFPLVSTTDSFGLYGVIGSGVLWTLGRALTRDRRYFLIAGGLAGLAALTRADGLLLALLVPASGAVTLLPRARSRVVAPRWAVAVGLALCLAVMAPWLARNLSVFGEPLPGMGLRTIFLRDYNDLFTYPPDLSWDRYRAWGLGSIVASKVWASGLNLLLLASLLTLYGAPLALIGFWRARHAVAWWPALTYLVALFVAHSWIFTLPGQRGAFFHSVVALQPYLALAALLGLDQVIEWVGARFPGWSKRRARRNYARLGVAAAVITSLGLAIREAQTWDDEYLAYRRAAEWLARHGDPVATVMVADAPAYHYVSRGRVVAAVNADLDTSVAVARRFAVRYLILEPAHPLPWHDFYLGRIDHPALRPIATLGELRIYEIAG